LIGDLFTYKTGTKSKTELYIVVTPHVVKHGAPNASQVSNTGDAPEPAATDAEDTSVTGAMPSASTDQPPGPNASGSPAAESGDGAPGPTANNSAADPTASSHAPAPSSDSSPAGAGSAAGPTASSDPAGPSTGESASAPPQASSNGPPPPAPQNLALAQADGAPSGSDPSTSVSIRTIPEDTASQSPPPSPSNGDATQEAASHGGRALVQVGAFPSREAAQRTLASLVSSFADRSQGKITFVETATKDGVKFYRAYFGGFSSQAEASTFCSALQAGGNACFVRVKHASS
jgi:hypothetical protein